MIDNFQIYIVLGNLSSGQTCKHDVQCTATEYNGRCINGKCDCAKGHVLHELSCIPGNIIVENKYFLKNECRLL